MTAGIRYEDVLRYLESDAGGIGQEVNGFQDALALLTPILNRLRWAASPEALENLVYHLDDNQRQWLRQLAEAANRRTEAELAAEIDEETYQAQKDPRFGEHNPERMQLTFWQFMVRRGWRAWDARAQFDPGAPALYGTTGGDSVTGPGGAGQNERGRSRCVQRFVAAL